MIKRFIINQVGMLGLHLVALGHWLYVERNEDAFEEHMQHVRSMLDWDDPIDFSFVKKF